ARDKDSKQPDVVANLARAEIRSGHTVDQERCVLEDVVATNPRCEWRDWASDLMGIHPLNGIPIDTHILPEPLPLPSPTEQMEPGTGGDYREELPFPSTPNTAAPSEFKLDGLTPKLTPATRLLPSVPSESSSKDQAKS
ncbi:MAG TPA: hypothetical protein VGM76_01490, partial [Lacipirellulaceae bacterium]